MFTKKVATAALAGMTLGWVGLSCPPAGAAAPSLAGSTTCSLAASTLRVSTAPDTKLNQRFTTLGNTSGAWVGADSTYSVPLADGTIAWLFSDTLYGNVVNGKLSSTDSFFLNNSVVLDDGRSLTTRVHGTPTSPLSLIEPDAPNAWYWVGDGVQQSNGRVQVAALRFTKFGTGIFDFGWDSNKVATFDQKTWALLSLKPLPSSAGVQWGSWWQKEHGYTLVYGIEDLGASKYMHIAKVLGNDMSALNHWRYWTGSGWSTEEQASVRVMAGVGNEYSVTPYQDGYLLVTQDTNESFSNRVLGYTSCSPTGPFTNPTELFRTPETGLWGSYGDPNIFTYNAHEHPELRAGNTLTVSYNVNTFDSNAVYSDVSIYRPRFVNVTITSN